MLHKVELGKQQKESSGGEFHRPTLAAAAGRARAMMVGAGEACKEYAAGFAAGVATVITGHPFDTVKVKLQAHNTKGQKKFYKSALHCTARILSNEGVKGLYRGASSSFIGMAFESSLIFGLYSQMTQSLQGKTQSTTPQLQCRMQVQGTGSAISNHTRYGGPLDCALQTLKNGGIQGIYRGCFATLLRESIGNAVFFSTYELIRYHIHSQLDPISVGFGTRKKLLVDVGTGIFSGGLAGMAFWSAVLPLDVAKTVIQTAADRHSSRNPFQTIYSIYRRVGLSGCYAGLGPTLMRAFPANAAAIVTWELTAKILGLERT